MTKTKTIGHSLMALAVTTGLLCGAAATALAQDVSYNALPETDFSKYKTYRWVTIEGAQPPDAITNQQITDAIDKQLALKGLAKSSTDAADLFVAYQLALGQEKQMNAYTTGGYGWGWRGYGMGTTTVTTNTIVVGQLGLDIYDAGAKQLVWRGKASKTVDTKAKPEKRVKNLDKAMAKLLKNYPPPVKK